MSILRIFRGILGMSVLWSVGFVAFGLVLITVIRIFDPPSIDAGEGPIDLAPLFASLGAIAGTLFGVVLTLGERRRAFRELSLPRMAVWGAVGGALLPLVLAKPLGNVAVFAPLGALLATGSLWLARRADRGEIEPMPAVPALNEPAFGGAEKSTGAREGARRDEAR